MKQLDVQTLPHEQALTTIAKDSKLLLERGHKSVVKHLSVRDLTARFALVQHLLASIAFAHQHCFQDRFALCSGQEVTSPLVYETFIANLEHLLLCLQTELLLAPFRHGWDLVQKHVNDCQKEQSRRSEDWFFEYPDARHPLSTTWPWSIRPSLAVLWGVCWMFWYIDAQGNCVHDSGQILLPAHEISGMFNHRRAKI